MPWVFICTSRLNGPAGRVPGTIKSSASREKATGNWGLTMRLTATGIPPRFLAMTKRTAFILGARAWRGAARVIVPETENSRESARQPQAAAVKASARAIRPWEERFVRLENWP